MPPVNFVRVPHDAREMYLETEHLPLEFSVFESREGILQHVRDIDDTLALVIDHTLETA